MNAPQVLKFVTNLPAHTGSGEPKVRNRDLLLYVFSPELLLIYWIAVGDGADDLGHAAIRGRVRRRRRGEPAREGGLRFDNTARVGVLCLAHFTKAPGQPRPGNPGRGGPKSLPGEASGDTRETSHGDDVAEISTSPRGVLARPTLRSGSARNRGSLDRRTPLCATALQSASSLKKRIKSIGGFSRVRDSTRTGRQGAPRGFQLGKENRGAPASLGQRLFPKHNARRPRRLGTPRSTRRPAQIGTRIASSAL